MEYPQSLVRLYQKGRFTVDVKPLFSYRQGTSILHKMPALLKIPLLFILNALVFFLPAAYCVSYALVCTVCARYAGFSFKQQLYDLKPVAGYALLLLCAHALSEALGTPGDIGALGAFVLKLICAVQTTSLFFNTTTSLELKQALEKILPKTAAISFTLFFNSWQCANLMVCNAYKTFYAAFYCALCAAFYFCFCTVYVCLCRRLFC